MYFSNLAFKNVSCSAMSPLGQNMVVTPVNVILSPLIELVRGLNLTVKCSLQASLGRKSFHCTTNSITRTLPCDVAKKCHSAGTP